MKLLSGAEIAGYMKESQARQVRVLKSQKITPKLVIIRNSDSPVILKYVQLKQRYGEDIGVIVEDWRRDDVGLAIREANYDPSVHGVIVQLPLEGDQDIDALVAEISSRKDVDGLATELRLDADSGATAKSAYSSGDIFESATATAINWLLAGYDISLSGKKIALVGYGRLIGKPLARMWRGSDYDVTVFRSKDSLDSLNTFDIIVSATGVPHLIKTEHVRPGAVVIDAGTASEGGVLMGDVDGSVRERSDLSALTPKVGGVGPLTVAALFDHVLQAAKR